MADESKKASPATETVEVGLATGPWSLTDHGKRAEMKINNNPFDIDSWEVLLREAQSTAPLRSKMFYEKLVGQFPTSARYWRMYIEQEMRHRCYEEVEKLFQRCLIDILHIDLWKLYIMYIRETKASLPNYREKLRNAYEFTLEHMGMDFFSSPVWMEYIDFQQQENPQGSYAENLQVQMLRKSFQQAVSSPKMAIEQIWRDYNTFEQNINKATAKKMIDGVSKAYFSAKRSTYEYENVTRGIIRGSTSVPPQGTIQEMQQLQIWRRYLAWEKQNPLRTEDRSVVVKRVMYAYNQFLLCFAYCPDVWYEAAFYLQKSSEGMDVPIAQQWADEARTMYTKAISGPLPDNLLINFAYADFEELHQHNDKAEAVYAKLLANDSIDHTLVYIQYINFSRRVNGVKGARAVFKKAREDSRCGYHTYVAAALMEYYITKDKDIAFRIFELGMKKFGTEIGFLLAYVDYLSHLNEDNNTRVLFEKAVTAVPPDQSSKLWERFTTFESTVGDLSSLLKVERRRGNVLRSQDSENLDSILLVDRYKYLDLFPCSLTELKTIGHPSISDGGTVTAPAAPVVSLKPQSVNDSGSKDTHYSKPDVKQMLSFKPSTTQGVGMNAVPGGHFPLPSAVIQLMSILPPPQCFQGPFVHVDELIELIIRSPISEISSNSQSVVSKNVLSKRRREEGEDTKDETVAPPTNDIYISRQQKRSNAN